MSKGSLVVFLKAPVAGHAKTRLGAAVGAGRAAALARVMAARTIARVRQGPWRTILAIDPPTALLSGGAWPGGLYQTPQIKGDLGARMGHVMKRAPAGPVVIIGADAPDLRAAHIRQAFARLKGADAVFGPAEDGGYWLIGLARRPVPPRLFEGVRWSSETALEDTLKSLPPSFRIAFLERLCDIDEAEDLRRLGHLSVR